MDKVQFQTEDGVTIVGDWYPAKGDRFALLLHMMPATKESWMGLAAELNSRGISCLAIDLRVHGKSTKKDAVREPLDYRMFSDEEQQAKAFDVEAALLWLQRQGMRGETLAVAGASIGANLAIPARAANNLIPVGIALSPGIDFHGVKTDGPIERLAENQTILLVGSEDDPTSFSAVNELHELNRDRTYRIVLTDAGHGTTIRSE